MCICTWGVPIWIKMCKSSVQVNKRHLCATKYTPSSPYCKLDVSDTSTVFQEVFQLQVAGSGKGPKPRDRILGLMGLWLYSILIQATIKPLNTVQAEWTDNLLHFKVRGSPKCPNKFLDGYMTELESGSRQMTSKLWLDFRLHASY